MDDTVGMSRALWFMGALVATIALLVSSLSESSPAGQSSCRPSFSEKSQRKDQVQVVDREMECWLFEER